jgi:hypothetical protein
MTHEALSPDPIADLWREARAWLAAALRDFRGPVAIARTLADDAREAIRRRLVMIETLLLKLLLIEAAAHPGWDGGLPARMAASARSAATENARSEDAIDPETWRVRFHLRIPPEARRRAHTGIRPARLARKLGAAAARARVEAKARYLARRFEALRRVLADPRRTIIRLARKLTALGGAAYAAARRIALARAPRTSRLGPTLAHAMVHACDASFNFRADTS